MVEITTNYLKLGIGNHPTLNLPFNGEIDEISIWEVALYSTADSKQYEY
jgi:hypothetical protein